MTQKKIDPIRPTDDEARSLAAQLVAQARFAALAVLEPESGYPLVSRVAVGLDPEGELISLASELSFHSKALESDTRISLLLGEPGKGDPLAHPRITMIGRFDKIDRASEERNRLREPWLVQHPKSALYIDFGDFHFFRLALERAHLNGGFGKAFVLTPQDLRAGAEMHSTKTD